MGVSKYNKIELVTILVYFCIGMRQIGFFLVVGTFTRCCNLVYLSFFFLLGKP